MSRQWIGLCCESSNYSSASNNEKWGKHKKDISTYNQDCKCFKLHYYCCWGLAFPQVALPGEEIPAKIWFIGYWFCHSFMVFAIWFLPQLSHKLRGLRMEALLSKKIAHTWASDFSCHPFSPSSHLVQSLWLSAFLPQGCDVHSEFWFLEC